jgi:hypothetical protein
MYYLRNMRETIEGKIEYIKEKYIPCVEMCGIVFVFWLSKVINSVSSFFTGFYQEYDIVRNIVDKTKYITTSAYKKLTNCKCEPFANTWICSNIVDKRSYPISFFDTYTELDAFNIHRLHNYFITFLNNKQVLDKSELVILKGHDEIKRQPFYICRRPNRGIHTEYRLNYSSVHFLSVNYKLPDQTQTISLDIDKKWCVVGNEILSYTHVMRMLTYQNEPCVFSMDYVLEIIDSNVKVFKLMSDEFIRIGEKEYFVEKVDSESDDDSSEAVEF